MDQNRHKSLNLGSFFSSEKDVVLLYVIKLPLNLFLKYWAFANLGKLMIFKMFCVLEIIWLESLESFLVLNILVFGVILGNRLE